MCACNKGASAASTSFIVQTSNGEKREVRSEQEARAIVRVSGGSYSKK